MEQDTGGLKLQLYQYYEYPYTNKHFNRRIVMSDTRKEDFMSDLQALLNKHNAELEVGALKKTHCKTKGYIINFIF